MLYYYYSYTYRPCLLVLSGKLHTAVEHKLHFFMDNSDISDIGDSAHDGGGNNQITKSVHVSTSHTEIKRMPNSANGRRKKYIYITLIVQIQQQQNRPERS